MHLARSNAADSYLLAGAAVANAVEVVVLRPSTMSCWTDVTWAAGVHKALPCESCSETWELPWLCSGAAATSCYRHDDQMSVVKSAS